MLLGHCLPCHFDEFTTDDVFLCDSMPKDHNKRVKASCLLHMIRIRCS